jgi:hypothetical protein
VFANEVPVLASCAGASTADLVLISERAGGAANFTITSRRAERVCFRQRHTSRADNATMTAWNEPKRILPLFTVTCGKRWEDLEPDSEQAGRRHCADCSRFVYRADSENAFETLRSEGHCVNVPIAMDRPEMTGAAPRIELFPDQSAAQTTPNAQMSRNDWFIVSTVATIGLIVFGWIGVILYALIRAAMKAIFSS